MSGLKICCIGILLVVLKITASAQVTAPPVAAKNNFKLIFEKVYLHTDREHYTAGENIWFKAYLLNAQTNQLLNSSNNLYVELIDTRSAVIDRKLIRLDNGLGKGDFKLGDSIIAGTYRIRAYTNWMLNYGDNFIFEKEIHLYNDIKSIAKPVVTNTLQKKTNNKTNAAPPAVSAKLAITNTPRLRFFPEGGSMIEQAPGIVAFKAEDADGKGLSAKGDIYSSAGDKIVDFESAADGMGSFVLLPQPGLKYEARGMYNNKIPFTIQLPMALLKGFSFTVHNADTAVKVIINTNALTLKDLHNKTLSLLGKSKGVTVFATAIPINGEQTAINISRALLPQGITAITLFDSDNKPQCERLLYNEKPERGIIVLKPDNMVYEPKSKVTLNISTINQDSIPVKANLSVAVVDAGLIPPNRGNILSYVYLQSEIRGVIQNPAQYFDEHNPQRKTQIDLLMLTQGWRDFVWKRLADSAIRISYALEQGISLSGRVREIWADKPISNMNITLFANGAVGTKLFSARTDTNGHYIFDGLNFYGNQQMDMTSANDKGSQKGYIVPDTSGKAIYPIRPANIIADSLTAPANLTDNILKRKTTAKKYKITDTTQLKEVTISTLRVQRTLIDTTFKMTRNDYKLETLYDYLMAKVPNIYSAYPKRVYIYGHDPLLKYIKLRPVFTSDHLQKPARLLRSLDFYSIPLDQILEIHFRKITIAMLPTIAQKEQGFVRGDNFWVDLKVKPHAFDNVDFHTSHFDIDGYYEARTFYAPDYSKPVNSPDYRTTIHWAPDVSTPTGNAVISYYNADPKTKVRIIAEGITDKGIPVFGTTTYEIK
jgi:hypothetical protein